jgi:Holliday junction resolvasome RuvABC endonuclease subunit
VYWYDNIEEMKQKTAEKKLEELCNIADEILKQLEPKQLSINDLLIVNDYMKALIITYSL